MIEIERHIEILLLTNDCVIVPGLGGFMAHYVDARYDLEDSTFIPPLRTLGFNPQLTMNDSLLVQSYIEAYDISYPEALRRIESEVTELRQHLETEGQFELNDIGLLRLNEEGKIEFTPCEAGILTPELYGLGTFEMLPLKSETAPFQPADEKKEKTPVDVTGEEKAIVIKMSWLRNVTAVAAAVVAFFMIVTPVSNSGDIPTASVQQSAFVPSSPSASPATSVTSETEAEGSIATEEAAVTGQDSIAAENEAEESLAETGTEDAATTEPMAATNTYQAGPTYCIVLASQVSQHNADSFIGLLEDAGFHDATILMTKFRRVIYGRYVTEEEAVSRLREFRSMSKYFKEAWVMKIDN